MKLIDIFNENYFFETKATGPFDFERMNDPIRIHYQQLRQSGKQVGSIDYNLSVIQTPPVDNIQIIGVRNVKTGMILCLVKFGVVELFKKQYIDIILIHSMSSMIGQFPQLANYVDNKALTNLLVFMKSHYTLPIIELTGYQSNEAIRAIKILSKNNNIRWLNIKTGQIVDYDPNQDNPKQNQINEPFRSKTNRTDWRIISEQQGLYDTNEYPIHDIYTNMLSRGLKSIFEDLTIPNLQQSTTTGFPDTKKRQNATNEVRVDKLQYQPFQGNKLLRVESITTSTNGNKHKQLIDLRNVTFEGGDSGSNVTFKSKDGQDHSVQPIPLTSTNVGVSCDCSDYTIRFANYNLNNNCHIGPIPPRYVRKTTTRPPANPNRVPGMCKHLFKVISDLQGYGLIK